MFLGTILLYFGLYGETLVGQSGVSKSLSSMDFGSLNHKDIIYLVFLVSAIYMLGVLQIYAGIMLRRGFDKDYYSRYEFAILSDSERIFQYYILESKISNIFSSIAALCTFVSMISIVYGIFISKYYFIVSISCAIAVFALIHISKFPFKDFDVLMAKIKSQPS